MQQGGKCPECGGEIPRDANTMGLCPRCLVERVLDVRRSVREQMDRLRPEVRAPAPEDLTAILPGIEVIELLAVGGMGAVYRARQRNLDREVALKIVPVADVDEELATRFAAEARILAGLNHPNIVVAYESGRAGEYLYLTMELVGGPSLRTILKKGAIPWRPAVRLLAQVCDALSYAHQRQVIHRDIKPENILLDPGAVPAESGMELFLDHGGRARLADFGLARSLVPGQFDLSITAPQHLVGTSDYIAPERRTGKPATEQSDIYALGVVLYEMLTGVRPVGHFAMPSRLAEKATRLPSSLDRIVVRCLASDPSYRYADAEALKADLQKTLRSPMVSRFMVTAALVVVAIAVWSGVVWQGVHTHQPPVSGWYRSTAVSDTAAAPPPATSPTPREQIVAAPATLPAASNDQPAEQVAPAAPPPPPAATPEPPAALPEDDGPRFAVQVPTSPMPGWRGPMMPFAGGTGSRPEFETHGPEYTITMLVEGVSNWQAEEIRRQLKSLVTSGSTSTNYSGDVMKITVAPFADLDAFVKGIEFAKVTSIDRDKRVVKMRCTLPTTQPAAE